MNQWVVSLAASFLMLSAVGCSKAPLVEPTSGAYPLKVKASGGSDWNFGDGSPVVSGGDVYHVYWQPGTYQVQSSDGGSPITVNVSDAAPAHHQNLFQT